MRTYALTLAVLALVCGCNLDWIPGIEGPGGQIDPGGDQTGDETGSAALKTFQSEDDLKQYFASVAEGDFRAGVRGDDGAPVFNDGTSESQDNALGGEGAAPKDGDAAPTPSDDSSDPGFSDTTTQEEGVQEADVMKNDSTYLYVLTAGWLRIVQASPGEQMHEVGAYELGGWGQDMYKLPADADVATTIVAITQTDNWYGGYAEEGVAVDVDVDVEAAQVTPEIGLCWFSSPETVVTVLDVSSHGIPVIVSKTTLDGSLGSSRMIDNRLYLTLFNYPDYYGGFRFDEVEEVDAATLIPDYKVELADGTTSTGDLLSWDTIYRPTDPDGLGLASIVSLDVTNPAALSAVGVMAYPGNLYASPQAIYLTDTGYNYSTGDWRETTDIYKFAVSEAGVSLTAAGSVPGRVLNQYSMSEYGGYLRIATTTGPSWEPENERVSVNSVYVLGEQAGVLNVVGSVENLAPGEEIKSARFLGTRGFLVTFEQVDPLFTFDLSNPTNPVKVGEWHGPGYSAFIMPMGENHLLTIGQSMDTEGEWIRANGVQLSVFDVTNFAAPQLLHQRIIGSYSTWSEALYNPKAFTYYASRDLMALPITDWGWEWDEGPADDGDAENPVEVVDETNAGSGGGAGVSASQAEPSLEGFDGVYVYRVTEEAGFEYLGRLTTRTEETTGWWYYSAFSRGVFLGDNVYIVNELGVVGAPTAAVDTAPWRIAFPLEEMYPEDIIGEEPEQPGQDEGPIPDPETPAKPSDDGTPVEDL